MYSTQYRQYICGSLFNYISASGSVPFIIYVVLGGVSSSLDRLCVCMLLPAVSACIMHAPAASARPGF